MSPLIPQCPDPDPNGLTHFHLMSDDSGALSQHLLAGCCSRLVGQSVVPHPTRPPFRSHCFLRPLSLFLYHRLIHPATRALSGPVSHPAVFTGDESCKKWQREGGREGGVEKGGQHMHDSMCQVLASSRSSTWGALRASCACVPLPFRLFTCARKWFIKRGSRRGSGGRQVHSEAQESFLT